MEKEVAALTPKDFSEYATTRFAYLAALAAKLNDPRVDLWMEALQVALAQTNDAGRAAWSRGQYALILAMGSPELAVKFVQALEPGVQIQVLEKLILSVARRDLPQARQLLATLEALVARQQAAGQPGGGSQPAPQQSLDRAYEAVALSLAPTAPEAALELARKIKGENNPSIRPMTIAGVARYLKGEVATKAFREAAATRPEYWHMDSTSEIAALAYGYDRELGEELFEIARTNLAPRENMIVEEEQRPSRATYAFLRGAIDPAESRLLLETEWARRKDAYERAKDDPTDTRYSYTGSRMSRLAQAMAAVDMERALQMLRELEEYQDHDGGFTDVRPLILSYVLATTDARRTMRFEGYLRDDE
jgi:hypothetical protein